ncbi:MAG: hypothetical protein ABSA72_09925 [Nitrososphaerales archaeon]
MALTALVIVSVAIAFTNPVPYDMLYQGTLLANVSGFLAFFLIAASGGMMVFRRSLLRRFRNPDLLRGIHVWVAAAAGVFLIIHVVFFLLFPVTLPVLFGYVATYAAFVIWVSGLLFIEGLRSSLFYHGILSLIGASLILVHVLGAGRSVPVTISGIALVLTAAVVLGSAVWQFARLSKDGNRRSSS